MNETDAHRVMLVRAIEFADTGYSVWSREDRRQATETAHNESSSAADADRRRADSEELFLARRAELAYRTLEREHPEIARTHRVVQWPRWLGWLLPLIAFVVGFVANELSAGRRINIISFPLLGMLAWNAAVYALIIAGAIAGIVRSRLAAAPGPVTRLLMRFAQPVAARSSEAEPLARGLERFVTDWLHVSAPLNSARARALLHLSAALLATGAVVGLYVRGLGFEYLAGWESTFLTEHTVHRMLTVVLGPASVLSGIAIPPPEHLATLRWSDARMGENAAAWIHLYAITASLFIVLPRLALALWTALWAQRLRRNFDLPVAVDPYFRRLLSIRHGKGEVVQVVPYSYHPDARSREALRDVFAELLGDRVKVDFHDPVAYGGEDDYFSDADRGTGSAPAYLVVLFNVAATPEDENHGELVAGFQQAFRKSGGGTSRLVIILNESPYRQRLAGQGDIESRLAERREAWETMLHGRGAQAVLLDLEAGDAAVSAQRLETAIAADTLPGAAR